MSDTDAPPDSSLQPSPYAATDLPTPRVIFQTRWDLSRVAQILGLSSIFGFLLAAYLFLSGDSLTLHWTSVGVGLTLLALWLAARSDSDADKLANIPDLGEVYLARRYAWVASTIAVMTTVGMVFLFACIAGSATLSEYILALVSPTSETITAGGVLLCLSSSYGLVRALLSHAPPYGDTSLRSLERSSLPELVFTLGLLGCPAFVIGSFLWQRPALVELPVVIPTHGVLLLIAGLTLVYVAVVTRV